MLISKLSIKLLLPVLLNAPLCNQKSILGWHKPVFKCINVMYTDCGAVDDNGDGNLRKRPYYRSHNTPFLRTLYNFLVNFLEASGLAIGSICDTISSHFDSFFWRFAFFACHRNKIQANYTTETATIHTENISLTSSWDSKQK